ncbi:MAG: ABC transporter ATP-binding protein [Armatimonadetes bacterium]|nr:ABC transporter ATP-binding protein [Armatimonadota bacterium]
MGSFARTLEFLRPYRSWVALAVGVTLVVTVLQIIPPRAFQYAIDSGIEPALAAGQRLSELEDVPENQEERSRLKAEYDKAKGEDGPRVLKFVAVLLMGVLFLRAVLNYVLSVTVAKIGHRFCFDLRFATWSHLQRLSLAFHKQTQTGKIMSRATADIELIQGLIQGQLVVFFSDVITLFAVIGMLFYLEWRIAAIILTLVPFYVISYRSFLKFIRAIRKEQRRLYDEMVGKLAEKISGIAVVKAFVREGRETDSFMGSVGAKFKLDRRQMHLNRRLGLLSGVLSAVGTGVVYAYGGNLVQQGAMTVGTLVAITFYIGFVFQPAVRVVDFNTGLQWAVAAMDRVFETLDTRPEIEDAEDAVALPEFQKELLLDRVSFGYAGEAPIINEVVLKVKRGEIVGVVGHSGAGKTTLMNLMMRFYDPTKGHIMLDGHDLRHLRLDSLRRQMSMVAQENVVFSASLAENVRYGNRNATMEQVVGACKVADLHTFISAMDEGYDTLIGERGIKLSGGQRQRLALARALVTDPKILILDDVTSSLDGETEARVQEALRRAMLGRTTFIVSHRLASVVEADRIIVLDHGRIVDQGVHSELVGRPGIYQDMFYEQFKSVLDRPTGA